MISVHRLITILQGMPQDWGCSAYEGEDTGLLIQHPSDKMVLSAWVRARPDEEEDIQSEGALRHG